MRKTAMAKAAEKKQPKVVVLSEAEREAAEAVAEKNFSDTRSELVIRASLTFWAVAGLRLRYKANWNIPTAATDARHIFVNPAFWNGLEHAERLGVLAHEISHCVLHHCSPARSGSRERWRWQLAIDCVVNDTLRDHFTFPGDCIYPETFELERGLCAEEYYAKIPDTPKNRAMGGEGETWISTGQALPAPQDGKYAGSEAEWKVIADQALAAARMRGSVPAGMERLIGQLHARVNWRSVLQEFLQPTKDDYSWSHPARRHIWSGTYLPGKAESQEMGTLAVLIDASGSMTDEDLAIAASEIESATMLHPRKVVVFSHETDAHKVMEWTPEDGPFRLTKVEGGGGTSHIDAFNKVAEMEEQPEAVIAFTDLMSEFPDPPPMPVLWVHRGAQPSCAPEWGQFISIPL